MTIETFYATGDTDFNPAAGIGGGTQFDSFSDNQKIPNRVIDRALQPQAEKKSANYKNQDDIKEHQTLVLKLSRYCESHRFKDYLSSHGFDLKPAGLKKKTIEELNELLQRVQVTISSKNNNTYLEQMILSSTQVAESVSSNIPKIKEKFDLTGLTAGLRGNEEFLDTIEQLSLENQDYTSLSAGQRLALIMTSTCLQVAAVNKKLAVMKGMIEQKKREVNKKTDERQKNDDDVLVFESNENDADNDADNNADNDDKTDNRNDKTDKVNDRTDKNDVLVFETSIENEK